MNTTPVSIWHFDATRSAVRVVKKPINYDTMIELLGNVDRILSNNIRKYGADEDPRCFTILYNIQKDSVLPNNEAESKVFSKITTKFKTYTYTEALAQKTKNTYNGNFIVAFREYDLYGRLVYKDMPPISIADWVKLVNEIVCIDKFAKEYIIRKQEAPPDMISEHLAKLAVKSLLTESYECPIALEPLSSLEYALVPLCGHICGPMAKDLEKCPICCSKCTWKKVMIH